MKGREVRKIISENVTGEQRIVRWWRKENDFVDYDLIGSFLEKLTASDEIGGIELFTTDQMLNEVKRVAGRRVTVMHDETGDSLKWVHRGKSGEHTNVCTLTPEALLYIYDVETRGNAVF